MKTLLSYAEYRRCKAGNNEAWEPGGSVGAAGFYTIPHPWEQRPGIRGLPSLASNEK